MISVIVPTRNRARLLDAMLSSLSGQTLSKRNFEVLVVDNGSTDDTQTVAFTHKESLPNLRYMHAPEPGLHVGRHAGMKAASGEILVFADDDIEALPSWLASISEAFEDDRVAMVGGNNHPLFMEPPPAWLNQLWRRPSRAGYRFITALSVIEFTRHPEPMSPYLIWGCNFAIRKSVLLDAGGFHPDGMPKDLIRFRGDGETHVSRFVQDAGLKCIFHPGASVRHKVTPDRMTFEYFRQRGFNQGVSDSFTHLRGQDAAPNNDARCKPVRRALIFARRKLLQALQGAQARKAMAELASGHGEGYAFHQAAYRDDPEVRDWVHRPVYF